MAEYIYREALQNYIDEMSSIDDNELIADARAKAIDEFMEVVKATYHNFCGFDLERMTKYGNEDASQQNQSYSTMMMYEIAGEFDDLIDALEQLKEGGK